MATQTSNLGLTKPAGTDFVQVTDFNGNSDIVDRSIGKLSELRTNVKSSLVEAINEAMISGGTDSPYVNQNNGHWMQWNNTLLKFEDTGIVASGSMWYNGTAITGTSATPSAFATSISLAHVGDLYLNIQTANVYWCAKEGNASVATWRYLCSIKGLTGDTGPIGPTGTTFTPAVNSQTGIISWSNDGGKTNPPSVSIKGPKGDPGVGLDIRGTYATLSDLQNAVTSPQQGWMYNVGASAPYRVYMYDSSAGWLDQGQLQGPTGSTGKSAYNAAVEAGYTGNEDTFNAQMAEMPTHITNTNNPHSVNKSQIGLSDVDNTSDLEKPISNAQSAVNQQVLAGLQDKQPLLTPGDNISIDDRIITTKAFPCNPNLLDNWYWNPNVMINIRGVASGAAWNGSYGIDRWKGSAGMKVYFATADGYLYLDNSAGATSGYLQQLLEPELTKTLVGKTMTASVLCTALPHKGVYSGTFTFPELGNKTTISTDFGTIEVGSGAESGAGFFLLRVTTGGTLRPMAAKLELGSTQTLAHQESTVWTLNEIPRQEEQERICQRYCFAPFISGSIYTRTTFVGANIVQFFVATPVTLRTKPVLASGTINVGTWGSTGLVQGFTYTYTALQNALRILANKTGHGLSDMWMELSKVIFSADL